MVWSDRFQLSTNYCPDCTSNVLRPTARINWPTLYDFVCLCKQHTQYHHLLHPICSLSHLSIPSYLLIGDWPDILARTTETRSFNSVIAWMLSAQKPTLDVLVVTPSSPLSLDCPNISAINAEYNQMKLQHLPTSNYFWSLLNDALLIHLGDEFKPAYPMQKDLYTAAASHFPNRRCEAFKRRLNSLRWSRPPFAPSKPTSAISTLSKCTSGRITPETSTPCDHLLYA